MSAVLRIGPAGQLSWLGPSQDRTYGAVAKMLGSHDRRKTTERSFAAKLGLNPGQLSRELARLRSLGMIAYRTKRGRLGHIELFRIIRSGWSPRLDPWRRARALRRMGVVPDGQLVLTAEDDEEPTPLAELWPDPPPAPTREEPAPLATFGDREPYPGEVTSDTAGYGSIRCACGRLRLTFNGETRGACAHGAGR